MEVAFTADSTGVRDSKRPHMSNLRVHSEAWGGFINAVRNEQLS